MEHRHGRASGLWRWTRERVNELTATDVVCCSPRHFSWFYTRMCCMMMFFNGCMVIPRKGEHLEMRRGPK